MSRGFFMAEFELITFNMHKGMSGVGRKNFVLQAMRQALAETGADIIFLQETVGKNTVNEKRVKDWPALSQFEYIADSLWPHHAYGKNAHYQSGHHGNAILSKYALKSWDNIDVSPYPFAVSRSLLHAVIRVSPQMRAVHLICVHLGFFALERRGQIRKLCEHIAEQIPHDEPLIIAGDFNDWRGIADKEFDTALELREAHEDVYGTFARSFPARLPVLRLDRIYFRGLKLEHVEQMKGPQWRSLSDHVPLHACFSMG